MPDVTPSLWFDTQAHEAAQFYCELFPNSEITNVARTAESGPGETGAVMAVSFTLDGQSFSAINGGPHFSFTPAVSFSIDCADQADVDRYWDALIDGGQAGQCGWLTDQYGLSWQVVPGELHRLLADPDPERAARATTAMLGMGKIDIAALRAAADGG